MPPLTDAQISQQVEEVVVRRIERDDLILPAMPVVASRCLALLNSPDFSLKEVAALIETDPMVAAQMVRIANVAARATREPARSIIQCVMRLGAKDLRLFLLEISAHRVFESQDRRIADLCKGLWTHSLAVAILTRDVLRSAGGDQPDAGYLGGLLHDIGKPIVAAMLLDAENRLRGIRTRTWLMPETWARLISATHRHVGVALAERWRLPEAVARCLRDSGDFDSSEPHSLPNAVRFANALAKAEGIYVGDADPDETESLVFVGRQLFELDDGNVQELVKDLPARVSERLS